MGSGAWWSSSLVGLGLTAVVVGLLGPSCSRQAGGEASQAPPNVVLIVLDTLRADHLSCYGYKRETSPNIDQFAEGATLYRDCVSTAPWTLPAHASLFTGKYPFEHGAYTLVTSNQRRRDAYPLSLEQLTLAEFLRDEGFDTGAFVANAAYCGVWTRLDQGFDRYVVKHVNAERLMPRIFAWLERRTDKPFFLFLNFMDTHGPYNVSPRPGFINPPADPDPRSLMQQFAAEVLPGTGTVPKELRRKILDQYDTAIANVDEQVGRMLAKLKALGLFENTVVVILSDHGNYFGEHLLVAHSKDVYQPALRVPLIVKAPRQTRGQVVEQRVSLTMVPSLICAQLPAEAAARAREHYPEGVGAEVMIVENYYSRSKDLLGKPWGERFKRIRRAVFVGQDKYIQSSDGQNELYNLEQDPNETINLLEASPELATRLAGVLDEFMASRQKARPTAASEAPLSDEELHMLAELGYVDGPDEDKAEDGQTQENETDDDD